MWRPGLLLFTLACALAQETSTVQETTITNNMSETTTAPQPPPEPPNKEKEGRALNMTSLPPLDDVTMEEELACSPGQMLDRGCGQMCECVGGMINCTPRQCPSPLVVKGSNSDSHCQEKMEGTDLCCVLLTCTQQSVADAAKSNGTCFYKNESYQKGATFNDACEAVCTCEDGGFVSCKPRCPAVNNTKSEKCLTLPDSQDPCCTVVLCDVSLDDHDASKSEDAEEAPTIKLLSAKPLNSSAVNLEVVSSPNSTYEVELSLDGSIWSPTTAENSVVGSLQAGKTYSFRVMSGGVVSNVVQATVPAAKFVPNMCEFKGRNYTRGEEFHDGCAAYCVCGKTGVECASIDCPTDFGLDVLDPHCLAWETQPADFVPVPPKCCPDTVKCKNNGSCTYKGEMFPNWADIPTKLSGCEQRCYCEMGNVTCHAACPPVPATPPSDLPCGPRQAILSHPPDDECCLFWMCPPHSGTPVDTKPTDTENTNDNTHSVMTNETSTLTTPILGPYNPDFNMTVPPKTKPHKNQTNNKKDFFPGPFSIQHLDEEMQKGPIKPKSESKNKSQKDNPLIDILSPFHLPPSEIPEIHHGNDSTENDNMSNEHKPIEPHFQVPIPDSKFEDDIPDTNEGVFAHFPFLSPPITKPSKHDKEKSKPSGFPGFEGPKPLYPYHPNFNKDDNKYIGPFKPPKSPEGHQTAKNVSLFDPKFKPGQNKGEKVGPVGFDSEGDHEFEYENDPDSPEQGHLNPNQLYFIHQHGFPQEAQHQGRPPNQDLYHIQHFQVPFDQKNQQSHKKKPIEKHQDQEQLLPEEILTHLHSLAPHLPKNGQIPPHLQPEEILHYVQQNPQLNLQQQHPPAHYLTPEEVYLYQNPDKPPHGGKIRPPNPQNGQPQNAPAAPGRDTIHIHSPTIPQSPSQRVEEILHQLRQQGNNQYPPQFAPLPPPHSHSPYQESLLPQHSSHAAVPLPHGLLNNSRPAFPGNLVPGGFPQHPGNQNPNEIKVHTLEAIDDTTVRLIFSVPGVLVGLHGRVELRYTSDRQNNEPATWEQQVLAPPDDLIATPELEFELAGLQPDTLYKIKIAMVMRDLANSPASSILSVKTLPRQASTTSYPPEIYVKPELRVAELNATWVKLVWRTFTEFELQFIDGVQIRYKEPHAQVFSATPLIHRAVTSYTLEGLKPDTLYQVGIYFIPFPEQTTELRAEDNIEITTAIENDPYSFELVLDVHHVKMSSVELTWAGVPYPEDKYINIFRAIYQSEGEREDFSSFKVAKRDSPPNTLITGLKPNTRYHLWLEAYLTNGRIKKSNVKEFVTKPGVLPATDSLQGKLEATPLVESSDYYGPLVAVSILATLAIAAVIILSLILVRKHGHNKAPITAANNRKAQSAAYDNPSYKVEIQQETMDL